jgi:small subunit ribosomal protein S17
MKKKDSPTQEKSKTVKSGVVVSDKMDKTIVVQVTNLKTHPKYLKKIRVSKRYKVCDNDNKYKVGDRVNFQQCRPVSKGKKWKVVENG